MIKVDKIDDGLPISVIIPLSKKRRPFFNNMVLPLIEANNPIEIIINDDDGSAPKKRNDGLKKATQKYVFFADDDILFPSNYLETLLKTLEKNKDKSFAYTGYYGIVLHPDNHPIGRNFTIPPIEFNGEKLKYGNYISTMTLVLRENFPGFDESLKRLQDWDVWLTMVKNGHMGILVQNLMFYAYYLDAGITTNTNSEIDAINVVRTKHGF